MARLVPCVVLALAASAVTVQSWAAEIQAGALKLTLDSKTGNLAALSVVGAQVPLQAPRAIFQVRDVKARSGFVALTGPVRQNGSEYVLEASAQSLGISARISFQASGGMLAYRADIVDAKRQERGLVVSMTLPLQPSGLVWSGDLYASEAAKPGALYGNNVTPVSAVCGKSNWAIAAAIPPSAPVMFDTHLQDGNFGLYYYVGLSSAPRDLPSRTWVVGLLYDVNPEWGFRSALQKYYAAHPDFYARRMPRVGAWCTRINAPKEATAAGCAVYEVGGAEWEHIPNVPRMGVNRAKTPEQWVEMNEVRQAHRLGVLLFPYTIVGQRQLFTLPGEELYTDYAKAMKTFEEFTSDVEMPYQNPANANSYNSIAELKEMIRNSGMHEADGRFVTEARIYTGNSLTFPLNPNPRLFFDNSKKTIAKYALEDYMPKILKIAPEIGGFYIDSMGHWGDFTNYRRDHFAYAKYPLAVDEAGNPVLRNLSSHYEYVEEVRKRMRSMNKYIFLNGVNGGGAERDGRTDHSASRTTSRFFLAALGDFCTTESGTKTTAERMGHYRIMSGTKSYAIMAYGNKPGEDELYSVYFKRATALGIFPSAGSRVYTLPALQPLSKILHERYLPLVQKLNLAGWEPVTGVTGTGPGILCERFGRKSGAMFVTLFNDGPKVENLTLHLEKSIFGAAPPAAEISGSKTTAIPVRDGSLRLRLEPAQLSVLQIQ